MEQFSEAERESVEDTVKRKYDELNKTEFKDEGNFFMEARYGQKNKKFQKKCKVFEKKVSYYMKDFLII